MYISVSTPRGDISLNVGAKPVELFCHLNPNDTYYSQQVRDPANNVNMGLYSLYLYSYLSPISFFFPINGGAEKFPYNHKWQNQG